MVELSVLWTRILPLLAALYSVYYWQFITSRQHYKGDAILNGKTVIITGGNSGIGRVTALDLAQRGARVILACRSLQKAQDAAEEIKARTGNSEVEVRHLDLASLQSVREFASGILESEERLDILINNAGIGFAREGAVTKDNFHLIFGINHFGHFLLTNLLLDLLRKSAPSRVITISSIGHEWVFSPLDLTRGDHSSSGSHGSPVLYPHLRSYFQSKLANVLFARELARRLESTGITSVSLHPGVIYTPIWSDMPVDWITTINHFFCRPFFWLFFIDEEAGAQTTLHCALDDSIPYLSGSYFDNCQETAPSALAQDDELAQRLWEVSCEATGLNC
ncbi:retinol dehydrogenase 13-like [Acanthaster planci]|uniref:Retinol dehydrogenase 13-like n=1 Tax=Acanthaster planci TaxID=133434 RepID=A0A8B7YUV8_ACAPL|nr:retinol dehydrogenase 13-like [Acanthaster planci]